MSGKEIPSQHFEEVIVSATRNGEAAISTAVDKYVRLSAAQWRWLVEDAGPNVLKTTDD